MPVLLQYIPYVIGAFLFLLSLAFVLWYVVPAGRLNQSFSKILRALAKSKAITVGPRTPQEFKEALAGSTLAQLWEEYAETIHEQRHEDHRIQYRATIQAAQIFTPQSVVDTPMNVEFFKHLPGILTGLGILGTFGGLIGGLLPFKEKNALTDPSRTQQLVGDLLNEVSHAFMISAIAIGCAMVATLIEKILYSRNLRHLDSLCERIDEAFQLGVGEEYLSQLVRAAEGTYDKTRQLKDSLVNDLKGLLESVTAAQVQAIQQSSHAMQVSMESNNRVLGSVISDSITGSLKEPLDQIARTTQTVAGDQSQGVQTLLTTVLQDFMDRLEGSFGKQFHGMEGMMSSLVQTLDETRRSMDATILQMRDAGSQSLAEVNRSLQEVLRGVGASQESFHQQSQDALVRLVGDLQKGQTAVLEALDRRARSIEDVGTQAVSTIGAEVSRISGGLEETLGRLEGSVHGLVKHLESTVATNEGMVRGLNDGAASIQRAVAGVTNAWRETENSITESRDTVAVIRHSTEQLRSSIEGLGALQQSQAAALERIQVVLAEAREATLLSTQARSDLNGTVDLLAKATQEYVTSVPKSLEDNFRVFGESLVSSVNKTQTALDQVWGGVLSDLRTFLQDMESFVESAHRDQGRGQS